MVNGSHSETKGKTESRLTWILSTIFVNSFQKAFQLQRINQFVQHVTDPTRSHHCQCVRANSLQWCLALCNPMDWSPPGSSVHEILQAIILEKVALLSSRGSPRPKRSSWLRDLNPCLLRLLHWQEGSLPLGSPSVSRYINIITTLSPECLPTGKKVLSIPCTFSWKTIQTVREASLKMSQTPFKIHLKPYPRGFANNRHNI